MSTHNLRFYKKFRQSIMRYAPYLFVPVSVTFNDPVRAYQILATDDPVAQKKLGRQVQNFDPSVWGKKSVEVVAKGSEQKVPDYKGYNI